MHTLDKSMRTFIILQLQSLKEKINIQFQLWNCGTLLPNSTMRINIQLEFKIISNFLVIKLWSYFLQIFYLLQKMTIIIFDRQLIIRSYQFVNVLNKHLLKVLLCLFLMDWHLKIGSLGKQLLWLSLLYVEVKTKQ